MTGQSPREIIDAVDEQLISLLNYRASVSRGIQEERIRSGGTRVDLSRENEVIGHYVRGLDTIGRSVALTVLNYCRGSVIRRADADEPQGQAVHVDGHERQPLQAVR